MGGLFDSVIKSSGLGDIAGGLLGANAANQAGNAQTSANNQLMQFLQQQNGTNVANNAPYLQAGQQATAAYGQQLGLGQDGQATDPNRFAQFYQTPGYQYQLDQGNRQIQQSQAAKGLLGSGSTLKALSDYGQSTAAQGYNQYLNRLAGVSGQGQQAVGQANQTSNQFADNYGGAINNQGNISASEYLNSAAGYGKAAGGALNLGAKLFAGGG